MRAGFASLTRHRPFVERSKGAAHQSSSARLAAPRAFWCAAEAKIMRMFVPALAVIAAIGSSPSEGAETARATVDIAPFVAREINPKVHLLTTPDDWYAAAIGNVILIEQSD